MKTFTEILFIGIKVRSVCVFIYIYIHSCSMVIHLGATQCLDSNISIRIRWTNFWLTTPSWFSVLLSNQFSSFNFIFTLVNYNVATYKDFHVCMMSIHLYVHIMAALLMCIDILYIIRHQDYSYWTRTKPMKHLTVSNFYILLNHSELLNHWLFY